MAGRGKNAGAAARTPASDTVARETRSGASAGRDVHSGPVATPKRAQARELDRLVHDRTRLAIVSALAANEPLTFTALKAITETTDGNLSVHARKLEDAGYITCSKSFEGRLPKTEYKVTTSGRRALESYLNHMETLIHQVRNR